MTTLRLPPGRIVDGRFTIQAELGRGATSVSYRAITAPNREVAIRLLDPSVPNASSIAETFRRAHSALSPDLDRYIVKLIDGGRDGESNAPFFVTPLVATPSLAQLVALCPFEPADAAALIVSLGRALDALHASRVAHLALKPNNVFVWPAPDRVVRLTDPSAQLLAESGPDFRWLAPEQMGGGRGSHPGSGPAAANVAGVAADVFSMALVAFYALTGGPLFSAPPEPSTLRVQLAQGIDVAARARELGVTLPAGVDAVLRRALDLEPGRRPASAGAFASSLANALAPERYSEVALAQTVTGSDPGVQRSMPPPLPPAARAASLRPRPTPQEAPVIVVPEVPLAQVVGDPFQPPPPALAADPMNVPAPAFPAPPGGPFNVGAPPVVLAAPSTSDPFAHAPQPVAAAPFPAEDGFGVPQAWPTGTGAVLDGAPPAPSTSGPGRILAIVAVAAGVLIVIGVGIAVVRGAGRPQVAAPSASASTTTVRESPPRPSATAIAAAQTTRVPAAPVPSPAPAASEEPPPPVVANTPPPTDASQVALGPNQAELTVVCEPVACGTVMIDGKPMARYPDPVIIKPGNHGVGASRPGYGGQWKLVTLADGERKSIHFTMTAAGAAPKQPCGKFLRRCD